MGQWGHGIRHRMLKNGVFHALQEKHRFSLITAFSPEHTSNYANHPWGLGGVNWSPSVKDEGQ